MSENEIYDETIKTMKDGLNLVKAVSNEMETIKHRHKESDKEKAAEKQ